MLVTQGGTIRTWSGNGGNGSFDRLNLRWQYSQEPTPAIPMLINELGRLIRGGLALTYELEAYTVHYGGYATTYILGGIVDGEVTSSVTAASQVAAAGEYGATVTSAVTAESSVSVSKYADGEVTSDVAAVSSVALNMTLYAAVQSAAEGISVVMIQGQEYPVWAINAETYAPSLYENFNFDSFTKIGDRYFACNETGLFELTGDDDAGTVIAASFMLGRDLNESTRPKHSGVAYLHGTSDGKLQVRAVTVDGKVYSYTSEAKLDDIVRARRVKFGRGIEAHYWQLEVRNVNGGDFDLDTIEITSINRGGRR